jgi:glycerol-3-phosphate cytidylyltransferase
MKNINRTALAELVKGLKLQKKVIVFTNGCFDILHVGHVRYLQAAKQLGDVLVLGLNSDSSVQALKGPTRPINSQEDRAEVLAALEPVDYIVIFEEITAEKLIETVQPDIYVKGGDYIIDNLPEAYIVRQYGGKIVLVPEVQGRSTTNMITKICDWQG